MASFMLFSRASTANAYLVAVLVTGLVLVIRALLSDYLATDTPLLPLLIAVTIAAWFGGLRPGLLAVGLSALAGAYLFLPPIHSLRVEQVNDRLRLALFVLEGGLISVVCEAQQRARLHAEASRQEALDRQEALLRQVAERTQAEAGLREAEERVRSVVDHAVDAIITIDEHGLILSFNPAAERTFGYEAAEVLGQNVRLLMPDSFARHHDHYLANYLRTGQRKIIGIGREVVGRRKDGSTFPMDLAVSEYRLGTDRRFSGVVRDISERKHAELALRDSEQQLRLALEAGRMGTWQWRIKTDEFTWTPSLEALHGPAPDSFRGSLDAYRGLIHPDDQERVVRSIVQTTVDGEDHHIEYRALAPDGSVRWIESHGKLFWDEASVATRLVGVFVDVTERKRAELALRDVDRRKDEFLATLSHELRNPLAAIRNAVEIQKFESSPGADLRWTREVVDRQARNLARLVEDLLDVSRISAGKISVRKERVSLSTLVDSAVETSRPQLDAAHHELSVSLPGEPLDLDADPLRLSQVLSNLLNNAAKYTPPGGRIALAAEAHGSDVVISVTDNGLGITAELLPRIFDVFSQGPASPEHGQAGLGIGLSLARALVELHGGTIAAESEGAGRGSRFTVRLPLASTVEPTPDVSDPLVHNGHPPVPPPRCRLLIADDLRDSADSLSMLFRLAGHEVETAYDGEQALRVAESMRPDVALLDIGMPKMGGYEVARRIRLEPWGKTLILIALTGWGKDEDRQRAENAGFNAHLVKPVSPDRLLELLARADVPPTA